MGGARWAGRKTNSYILSFTDWLLMPSSGKDSQCCLGQQFVEMIMPSGLVPWHQEPTEGGCLFIFLLWSWPDVRSTQTVSGVCIPLHYQLLASLKELENVQSKAISIWAYHLQE